MIVTRVSTKSIDMKLFVFTADDNVILELEPPPTTQAVEELTNPLPKPKLKKKKRQRALEESSESPKAKKMKVKGDQE